VPLARCWCTVAGRMPAMSAVVFTSTRSSGAGSAEGLGASSTVHSVPHQRPPSADAGRLGAHSRWPIRPWHITAMAPMMPQRLMGDWHYLVDGRISRGGRRLMLCSALIRQLVPLPRRLRKVEFWGKSGYSSRSAFTWDRLPRRLLRVHRNPAQRRRAGHRWDQGILRAHPKECSVHSVGLRVRSRGAEAA
jgi:hypothetical protein